MLNCNHDIYMNILHGSRGNAVLELMNLEMVTNGVTIVESLEIYQSVH